VTFPKSLLWYGRPPLPGLREKLQTRGFTLLEDPEDATITNPLLGVSSIAVLNHGVDDVDIELAGYKHLPTFINHGLLILVLVANRDDIPRIRETHLKRVDSAFPWDEAVTFLSDLTRVNFDNITTYQPGPRWKGRLIAELGTVEKLTPEERLLVDRAFQKAEEVHVRELKRGFTESRVFMAYEKRLESSIAHWTQPRLVKIGLRKTLADEVGAMKVVSPFVPFELRPNLEIHVEGFRKSVYVADFVDKAESMLDVARAGRAETAISNLFNRTLQRWRDRAWQCEKSREPLALAAQRLGMISPGDICKEYLESERIQTLGVDLHGLWKVLTDISFEHRAASIHGDLHGDNVRVRGDDAILIDLGSVKGTDDPGKGAPLCFDVAMLEVALVFTCTDDEHKLDFQQPDWEEEIKPFYQLEAILSTPGRVNVPKLGSWLFGCLQRVRAFGIYDQSDPYEYAVALVIAMWRWCKFPPASAADKGRRVVALEIGTQIIGEIQKKRGKSS
jgi:hypothetical protein